MVAASGDGHEPVTVQPGQGGDHRDVMDAA